MSRIRDEILLKSDETDGKYWAVSRGGETRLDLRFSDDARTSLQYHSMQKIEFFKEGAESGEDLIVIDITGVSRFEIFGEGLLAVYDGLNRQAARFVAAAASSDDQADPNGVFISSIEEFTAEELEEQKASEEGLERDPEIDDTDDINAFFESLSEEESGDFVEQAYQEAREAGYPFIDEKSREGDQARWDVVAEKVREHLASQTSPGPENPEEEDPTFSG